MSNGPRVQMRRYMRSFVAWTRTLSDDDMRQVVGFLQTLRHAHYVGQDRREESPETPPSDTNCIRTADGGCIGGEAAGLDRCMHDPQPDESEHNGQPILTEEKPDGSAH